MECTRVLPALSQWSLKGNPQAVVGLHNGVYQSINYMETGTLWLQLLLVLLQESHDSFVYLTCKCLTLSTVSKRIYNS